MKNLLFVFVSIIVLSINNVMAEDVNVSDAYIKEVLVHGSYFDTETFVVFFDKTAGGCEKMWVNTSTRQADRVFEIIMAAFVNNIKVDYSMDTSSPWPGSSGLTCEMRYVWLKKMS